MGIVPLSERKVTDEALMLRVRDHSCRESFAELFERWGGRIHRLCYRMSGSYQDAEDMVQDVFAKLFRWRKNYVAQARFEAFLWKIAINQTRDFARKAKRNEIHRTQFLQNQQLRTIDDDQRLLEIKDQVQQTLVELPVHYREVVVLRHFEGMRFADIAELLGVPNGTIASRMARALALMKKNMTDNTTK